MNTTAHQADQLRFTGQKLSSPFLMALAIECYEVERIHDRIYDEWTPEKSVERLAEIVRKWGDSAKQVDEEDFTVTPCRYREVEALSELLYAVMVMFRKRLISPAHALDHVIDEKLKQTTGYPEGGSAQQCPPHNQT